MDDLSKLGAFSDYVDWYLLESIFLALIRYLALMRAKIYAIHCINYACKKTEVAYHVGVEIVIYNMGTNLKTSAVTLLHSLPNPHASNRSKSARKFS